MHVVNTVNFSNHSGYGKFGGSKASAEQLQTILQLMEDNGMLEQARLLTGYVPGAEALATIETFAQKQKENRPDLIYLLDPVMGDSGKLYVSPDVVPIYKRMLPLATIITPNWFEVELLTDIKLTNLASIRTALETLHLRYQVEGVVISSLPLTEDLQAELPPNLQHSTLSVRREPSEATATDYIICICSYLRNAQTSGSSKHSTVHAMRVEKVSGYYSGVGDLFSALVLGHYQDLSNPVSNPKETATRQNPLSQATIFALQKTYHVLLSTKSYVQSLPTTKTEPNETDEEKDTRDASRVVKRMKDRELRLIQEQDFLRAKETSKDYAPSMILWKEFWDAAPAIP